MSRTITVTPHERHGCLRSPTMRLSFQDFAHANIKQRNPQYRFFARGMNRWPMAPCHRRSVMWKSFPCHDVAMNFRSVHCILYDVIEWEHFPRYWPFVRGIHRSPVISLHKGRWRGALMFSLICAWMDGWVNNREAGDLRCNRAHYDVTVMFIWQQSYNSVWWCYLL